MFCLCSADRTAPHLQHRKMNDSRRKVNIQPAENEFTELMRSLLARTDNKVNHAEQDFGGREGIDWKIILPKQAEQPEQSMRPLSVRAQ